MATSKRLLVHVVAVLGLVLWTARESSTTKLLGCMLQNQ